MSAPQANDAEKNIEIWKVKKLIKRLEAARGNGTSMISLIIPPKDQVSRAAKMLAEEFGTASNIKSRVNRLSVLSAITSTQQRLKLYSKVPPNGLVIYCGEIITQEGKERKINIDFEPFKPINTSLYLCDNKFHTEALSELLESDQKFGFIIMDGNGALFGTLSGNTREVVHKFSVDLPKKHGRGGQSALRFARLREEKRHNYVRKVAELAVQNFITNDKVNVAGLILAGSADFKNDLNQSDLFDQRLQAKVIKVVDVSYGGENGFNQAIELASETLSNVKFIQEKKLINRYFDEISQDSGKVCYGIEDTLKALELGACEILIVYENLEVQRWTLKDSEGGEVILHTNKTQEEDRSLFMDKNTGQEMEIVDQMPFLEWLAEKYRDFGATLEFVSDRSSEGNQFVKGFGGIGAILRYKVNFEQLADYSDDDEFYDDGKEEEPDAALDSFDESRYTFQPVVNIEDVFSAVQAGSADYGVVPIENSSNGAVIFTLDLFADLKDRYPDILICGEAYAWGQCKAFLNTHLRGVERQDCSSTSRAAEEAARDASGASAAVSSAMAAKMQGLDFLAKGINDRDDNTTRFFVLRRRAAEEAEADGEGFRPREWEGGESGGVDGDADMEAWKSLVSFTVDHNDPGALADSLAVFKPYKLNLTSINTRPSGVEKWNYIFFVEFRGRRLAGKEGAVNAALSDLGNVARNWRWLGSWESKLAT
ncbi:Prephenate dehydratase [Macrophomina phaseolina MS6]|uniref:Prephenate dehydratase n=2 Tax=Macrophomina phaseolina TaxID=35725 RepID=K2RTE7_MACPH|nr:Prephenate dehydratase [Macrophomina phaseolina MS6]